MRSQMAFSADPDQTAPSDYGLHCLSGYDCQKVMNIRVSLLTLSCYHLIVISKFTHNLKRVIFSQVVC